MKLEAEWQEFLTARARSDKFRTEGDKLVAESNTFRTEWDGLRAGGWRICAKGRVLQVKGAKIMAKADLVWAEAIISAHGNVPVTWKYNPLRCTVAGETYSEEDVK
ncbi:MAG: hypothetical protein QM523_01165 [Candidatus Pacebacteria bacterium]|nr:hypothetical protein [Candidatus Paceibacterota bacterium]